MMVAVDFNQLLNSSVQQYMLNGVLAAYIDARISRSSIPAGVHVYDVRDCSGEDGGYYIGTVEDHVLVNHAGSFITREPLEMLDQENGIYIDLNDDEAPWESVDGIMTLEEFLNR